MAATTHLLDDSPLTRYHRKLIVACSGGPFLDGFLLSIIGVALVGAKEDLKLDASTVGVAGAVSLVGLFVGSLLCGPITDRVGRKVMYTADLVAMIIASVACLWIDAGWQLILLRFIIGASVGADYPIATALLTEWIPKKQRGPIIGLLSVIWLAGAVVAFVVGFLFVDFAGHESWRLMLASGAVFSIIVLLLRMGSHESPRWLIARGRIEEAREDISDVLGRDVSLVEITALQDDEKTDAKVGLRELLRGRYLRRILFCGLFWMCFAIPQFALFTYGPIILSTLGIQGASAETLGQIVLTMGILLGSFPGMKIVESRGRRPLILGSFLLSALALLPLGLWPDGPAWFVMLFFFLFTFINGAGNILVFLYPNELFPTSVRGSAVGFATAISRIGAAIGTYIVPVSLSGIGTGPTLLMGVALTLLGFVISFFWAEETRNKTLSEVATNPHGIPVASVD
jgi:putative MFS transporter